MNKHGPRGMPAAPDAHHSRAAIVCFGGWGLQTMLHVWPRLALVQEERQALGTAAFLPDLDRLTAFAAIVPAVQAAVAERVCLEVQAVHPATGHRPPPGYLEGLLETFQRWPTVPAAPGQSEAERQGSRLLRRAQEAGVVQPLALVPGSSSRLADLILPARSAMGRLGLDLAPAIAGALVREVIDATRLDGAQPYDPFVQTTIYVVASLAEPHTSALMWPVLDELVGALGARHIARVVGFFGTGSFAAGASRELEEAAVHVALQELENLIHPGRPDAEVAARRQVAAAGYRPPYGWVPDERPGSARFGMARRPVSGSLLDEVYLVDREKSNQALAESPQELAVLVGNALEAFLVSGGADLVEEQLILEDIGGRIFPYSTVGTACDYVPLAEYLATAIAGEQQQLIRREVLMTGEQAASDGASLADLGLAQGDVLTCVLDAGVALALERPDPADAPEGLPAGEGQSFSEPGRAGWSGWLAGLRVAEDFLLPGAVTRQLRQAQTPALWRKIAESRLAEATGELDRLCDAVESAEGLPRRGIAPSAGGAGEQAVPPANGTAPASGVTIVEGLAPRAAAAAVTRLVEDICSASGGLLRARACGAQWNGQIEATLEELARADLPGESGGGHPAKMARWRRRWEALGAGGPSAGAASAAGGVLGLLAAAIVAGWLVARAPVSLSSFQSLALILAAFAVALVSAGAGWTIATWRERRLKRAWILLAREQLAQHARRRLQRALVRLYGQVQFDLRAVQASIEEATAELVAWAEAGDGADGRPPAAAGSSHLRLAHDSDRLWQTVREQVTQATAQGESGLAPGSDGGTESGAFARGWLGDDQGPLQPRRREHGPRARVQAILRASIDQAKSTATDADRPAAGTALAAIYRDYAALATRHLGGPEGMLAGHAQLVRQVAQEHDLERTLFGDGEEPAELEGEQLPLDFFEQSYTRARPAANYEVVSRLSRDGGDVEFGVTPEGGRSWLAAPARQRGLPLLASHDPLSLIFVRIVGGLALEDLTLAARCRHAYQSLSQADREGLNLGPAEETVAVAARDRASTGQR